MTVHSETAEVTVKLNKGNTSDGESCTSPSILAVKGASCTASN